MGEMKLKHVLPFPLLAETVDLDGRWILVSLTAYVGGNKWRGYDEDGTEIIVDGIHLRRLDWTGCDGEALFIALHSPAAVNRRCS